MVWKNFNIMDKAGCVGKGIVREFYNIIVHGSTLVIHLYWARKGTIAILYSSVCGLLIYAIRISPSKFCLYCRMFARIVSSNRFTLIKAYLIW